jgi:hypothetical protein
MILVKTDNKWRVSEKITLRETFEATFIGEILEVERTIDPEMVDILVHSTKSRYDKSGKEYKINANIKYLQAYSTVENFQLFMKRSFNNKFYIKQELNEIEVIMKRIGYEV